MLTGYFDETGHADDPRLHFVGMAGFVARRVSWINFEEQWSDALTNAELTEPFHMKDFAHSTGQFKHWKTNEEKRRLLLYRLLEIIRETRATPIGATVSLRDFETLTETQQASFRDPYYLCFQAVTRGAAIEAVFEERTQQVDTVYAFNGEFGTNKDGSADQLWQMIKRHYDHGYRLGSYASSTPSDACPLQAADLFAYELCHEFENRIKRPKDRMRWALRQILRMYQTPNPRILMLDRKELLRRTKESHFPDQTSVEEVESTQELSAHESMMRWLIGRGEFALDDDLWK